MDCKYNAIFNKSKKKFIFAKKFSSSPMSTKNNNASNNTIDFRHYTYSGDFDYSDILVKDCMIFILEGSMTVSYKILNLYYPKIR